ncbi:MAG: class I SAM-dependent methyltransferase [Deltaproteobacteria bacterium]|nr:class I SAM-dependent methyltransferase [Deltaproteobacteria bacterium]
MMLGVFQESADLLAHTPNDHGSGRILDVGCGYGGFIDMMRSRGWNAEGVDPSPAPIAAAAGKGLSVRLGTLEDLDAPKGYYSAVTMFYVLEHLPDPIGALRKVSGILSPGGILLVRVPHTTPIVRMLSPFGFGTSLYDAPYHLYDYSPSVLQRMLKEAGFVATRTFPGKPTRPSRFGPFVASVLFGAVARALYAVSGGRFLLPGVSKTTIARKPD